MIFYSAKLFCVEVCDYWFGPSTLPARVGRLSWVLKSPFPLRLSFFLSFVLVLSSPPLFFRQVKTSLFVALYTNVTHFGDSLWRNCASSCYDLDSSMTDQKSEAKRATIWAFLETVVTAAFVCIALRHQAIAASWQNKKTFRHCHRPAYKKKKKDTHKPDLCQDYVTGNVQLSIRRSSFILFFFFCVTNSGHLKVNVNNGSCIWQPWKLLLAALQSGIGSPATCIWQPCKVVLAVL